MKPMLGKISEDALLQLLSNQPVHGFGLNETQAAYRLRITSVAKIVLVASPIYGIVMGGYGWLAGHRELGQQTLQMFYSAFKMPLLLLATLSIALPAFFVFNSLAGVRDEFQDALRSILMSLAIFSVAICALAPLTVLFYFSITASNDGYRVAVLFNALMFGFASVASFVALSRSYRTLINGNANHRIMFWVWTFLFSFVGIQLGWTLRPFIGSPVQETTFFREESFTSAYLQLIRIIRSLL